MNPGFTSFNVSLQCLKASSLFSVLDDATLEHIVRRCRRETWKRRRQLPMKEVWERFHIGGIRPAACLPQ